MFDLDEINKFEIETFAATMIAENDFAECEEIDNYNENHNTQHIDHSGCGCCLASFLTGLLIALGFSLIIIQILH